MEEQLTAEEKAEWVDEAADAIRGQMKLNGILPELAVEQLSGQRAWRSSDAREILGEALTEIMNVIKGIRTPTNYPVLTDDDTRQVENGWYEGPDLDKDLYWPPVREALIDDLGEDALESIDNASNNVIAGAGIPGAQSLHTRGLVVGYVQSGKTTNFLSVIAKAADEGYRLIVVLAGMTNSLREQTQERLLSSLTSHTKQHWTLHTDIGEDFRPNNNGDRLFNEDERQLVVIKKNGSRLKKMNDWLDSVAKKTGRTTFPILVIDDEADQASINVVTSAKEKNRRSAINAQISRLLDRPRTSYVAYTATPFANILIDPNDDTDLYPENFITVLPRPDGYFGAEQLFGRDAVFGEDPADAGDSLVDAVREISPDDLDAVRPPSRDIESWTPELPSSLRDAVRWFLLSTAVRWRRGQRGKHSSMLVHSSPRVQAHQLVAETVQEAVNEFAESMNNPAFKTELEAYWDDENSMQPQNPDYIHVDFSDIWETLPEVLDEAKVVVDNGQSDERLDYTNGPQTVISVGGNTLSRGLTLEGLVCSYFARVSRTYDTLLQMGRWFGFRRGYEDLVRIWMTPTLADWFKDLATVEADLRRDLSGYASDGLTPAEFRAKIRLHPAMQVTSAAKMRNSKKSTMSFSGQRVQTIVFREQDEEFLSNNIDATRAFLTRLLGEGKRHWTRATNGSTVFTGVTSEELLDYLSSYRFVEDTEDDTYTNKWKLLCDYIAKESKNGELRSWDVSVIGQRNDARGTIDLGLENPVNLVKRTRVSSSTKGRASINTLVGPRDRINDLPFRDEEQWRELDKGLDEGSTNDKRLRSIHDEYVGKGVGHLTIYAIDRKSAPDPDRQDKSAQKNSNPGRIRRALNAVEDVIALGVFLPESETDDGVEYTSGIDKVKVPSREWEEAQEVQDEFETTVDNEEAKDEQEEDTVED